MCNFNFFIWYNPSFCQKIGQNCQTVQYELSRFLNHRKWHLTATTVALTWMFCVALMNTLIEPWQTIKLVSIRLLYWKSDFNFYDMNPSILTEELAKKQPILLVHGNTLDESSWIILAKKLKAKKIGPVYTVKTPFSLSSGCNPLDSQYSIIQKKVKEITSQYKQYNVHDLKINLIGHSSGGYFAEFFSIMRKDIGKVIKIGATCEDDCQQDNFYEIFGTYDVMGPFPSSLPIDRQCAVNSGHLGLLYSSEAHDRIIEWLS